MSQTQVETSTTSRPLGKIPQYTQLPETNHELDWADLATLDLSKFDTESGKQELAKQLHNAIQQIGGFHANATWGLSLTTPRLFLYHKLWSHSRRS
jgi:hypothetical protein